MKNILFSLLFIFNPLFLNSQDTDYKELFLAAESYFLFEEFNEALPLYLKIHRHNPDNDNVNFKIGVCYLNDPYQKDKSVSYLERAVKNINPRFRENNFKEKAAPLESLFYLGNAYRVNNQLEKAKQYYELFRSRMDPDVYDVDLVEDQIEACNAAASLMKKPIDYDVENIGNKINTRFADINPVVSGDETRMAFISKLQFYDAVFFSEKIDGEWTPPRNIIPELGVDGDVYPTSLSYDGTEMFIYRNDNFIGNLYSSKLVDGKWTALKKLNENINTRFWESHASVSKDGKTLYFSSNRKGGYGGLDIYRSELQANGTWGSPVNLGPRINSEYNDDTPFITESGDRIFFSSYGHYNMGGYDIFMSKKTSDGNWSAPLNIGYPINTTDDDQFFVPVRDGQVAYYSRFNEQGGFGRHDILKYAIYTPDFPRMFAIEGFIDLNGEESEPEEIEISVVAESTEDTLHFLNPDEENRFRFEVPTGKYEVIFDGEKFRKEILKLEVTDDTPITGIVLETPVSLEPVPPAPVVEELEELEDLLIIKEDSIIYVDEGEEARIRYNAERDSRVVIDVINDGELVLSDTVDINRKRQRFEFDPEPGENEVIITLTDEDGNSISKSLRVIDLGTPEDQQAQPEIVDTDLDPEISDPGELNEVDPSSDLDRIIEALIGNADGDLKDYLRNLDTEEHGISGLEDLINHLYNAADDQSFSRKDVTDLLIETGLLTDLDKLISELAEIAVPGLADYLLGIDPENLNISSQEELIDHLYDAASQENFSIHDVSDLLSAADLLNELEIMIRELAAVSSPELKDYLLDLDTEALGIQSSNELIDHLFNVADTDETGFSTEDVIDALAKYYALKDIELLIDELLLHCDGALNEYLSSLDPGKENINTIGDLFEHLIRNAEENGYTEQDVTDMFESYFSGDMLDALSILRKLKQASDGEILEFLNTIDKDQIRDKDREEFYNFLVNEAEKEEIDLVDLLAIALDAEGVNPENFKLYLDDYGDQGLKAAMEDLPSELNTAGNVFRHLAGIADESDNVDLDALIGLAQEYLANKDLFELYYDLIRNSIDEMIAALKEIDIKASRWTPQDLLDQTGAMVERGEIDSKDFYNAQSGLYSDSYVKKIIEKLISIAEGNLKNALIELDPLKEDIRGLGDIISYLLDNKDKYGYSAQEVYDLIEKYFSTDFSDLPEDEEAEDLDRKALKEILNNGVLWTAGILLLEGILILILILLARRKKKKKEKEIAENKS